MEKRQTYFDGRRITKPLFIAYSLIALGYILDGIDNMNYSVISPTLIENWGISVSTAGQVGSYYLLGMFFGYILGGVLGDRIGRKKTLIASVLGYSLMSILNGFVPNIELFMLARGITGIFTGICMGSAVTFITEVTSAERRGRVVVIMFLMTSVSSFLVTILFKYLILTFPDMGWRYILYIGGAGIIPMLFAPRFIKESPRWLISKGRVSEAEGVMNYYFPGQPIDLSEEVQFEKRVQAAQAQSKMTVFGMIKELFNKKNARYSIILMLASIVMMPAILLTANFAPTLLIATSGFTLEDSATLAMLIQAGYIFGYLFSIPFSDKGGHKIPIVIGLTLLSITALIYALLTTKIFIFIVIAIVAALITVVQPIWHIYVSENFPTQIRSSASGIVFGIGRLASSIGYIIIPTFVFGGFGSVGVFILIAVMFGFVALLLGVLGRKSANVSLEVLHEE